MRLLFDKNLSILSAQWAAATLAVDVLDALAVGLAGKTDREVRRFASETDRILVTLNADFGNLIRFSPFDTPGVIWLRSRPPTEANIRSILAKWLNRLREIDLHGQHAIVEEDEELVDQRTTLISNASRLYSNYRKLFGRKLLIQCVPVKISVIQANYISFNLNNGSSLKRDSAPRGFASICSGTGIFAAY